MISAFPSATFRDPAGSLSFEEDRVIRRVASAARAEAIDLLESPFCKRLQERGDLIGAIIEESGNSLSLIHPRVPFPTYPWEWTPSQWLAAAELTLDLCDEALAAGWILKDATPLNVLFRNSCPIFVDILSFERRDPRSSIWLAYGQYVRTFLLPLLMNRMLSWPLALSLFKRDGYEPADCYAALGWPARLSGAAFWPITLPTLLDRRKHAEGPQKKSAPTIRDPEVAANVLRRNVRNLRQRTRKALPTSSTSEWSEYQGTLTHYTPEQSKQKLDWVRRALEISRPARVLDVGANTGEFSALAAGQGAEVVAIERDSESADRLFRMARSRNLSIQTIHADIARPTPAVGWENTESVALLPRLEGQFELVLMLAVIHHLLLMEQIPLPAIMALCHRLTRRHVIIEWVPVEDPMFQSLMRGRDSLYGSLTEAKLLTACSGFFRTLERHALDNGRILFFLEKID
jgi:2-polyprenyl-3-methyl-5-hydroxy-6-metoxy-1,4-benzoquinol methylase